jgi:hypothetical protein
MYNSITCFVLIELCGKHARPCNQSGERRRKVSHLRLRDRLWGETLEVFFLRVTFTLSTSYRLFLLNILFGRCLVDGDIMMPISPFDTIRPIEARQREANLWNCHWGDNLYNALRAEAFHSSSSGLFALLQCLSISRSRHHLARPLILGHNAYRGHAVQSWGEAAQVQVSIQNLICFLGCLCAHKRSQLLIGNSIKCLTLNNEQSDLSLESAEEGHKSCGQSQSVR